MQPDHARFCAQCGAPLAASPVPEQAAPPVLPQPTPGQQAPQHPWPQAYPQPRQQPPQQAYPQQALPQPFQQQPFHQVPQVPQGYSGTGSPAQLWGRPVHFWLFVASVVAAVALFLPWYSMMAHGSVSWYETGYRYSDGTSSTWWLPESSVQLYGGGNGVNVFTLALAGAVAGLALKYRSVAWPRWARYTLVAVVALITWVGLSNAVFDFHIGPLLFAVAGGLAIPATLKVLKGDPA